jgi:hypothetical protein
VNAPFEETQLERSFANDLNYEYQTQFERYLMNSCLPISSRKLME